MNILLGLPDSTEISLFRIRRTGWMSTRPLPTCSSRPKLAAGSYGIWATRTSWRISISKRYAISASRRYRRSYGAPIISNPTGKPIPTGNTVLAPLTLGVGASWEIGSLYTNKNTVREATIEKQALSNDKDDALDQIRKEVHQYYIGYLQSLEQIKVLQDAVGQAEKKMSGSWNRSSATTWSHDHRPDRCADPALPGACQPGTGQVGCDAGLLQPFKIHRRYTTLKFWEIALTWYATLAITFYNNI